jgi:hypothetical protein
MLACSRYAAPYPTGHLISAAPNVIPGTKSV